MRLQDNGSVFLTRPTLRHHLADQSELQRRVGDVSGWLGKGDLTIRIHDRYSLADAARAQTDLQ